ncbi:hypothetical protein BHS07_26745 [Myxococcus xanthus]|nr:hypothetical protein BHS07_26745 [Myxococcus xanthus]
MQARDQEERVFTAQRVCSAIGWNGARGAVASAGLTRQEAWADMGVDASERAPGDGVLEGAQLTHLTRGARCHASRAPSRSGPGLEP